MIVTVTLNAALDVTHVVDRVDLGSTHRITRTMSRAGGKGLNVARVLQQLGEPVLVTGMVGGQTGTLIVDELRNSGFESRFLDTGRESRRTVTVVEDEIGRASTFCEPGPTVDAHAWERFLHDFELFVAAAELVVLSGSLPPGVPTDAYRTLIERSHDRGTPVILDADGEPFLTALAAHPDGVKPNREELRAATTSNDAVQSVLELAATTGANVVASLGAHGILAVTTEGIRRTRPPHALRGNPTGAGDALVAALARGYIRGESWDLTLTNATAVSAAAVLRDVAGDVDLAEYAAMRNHVQIETEVETMGMLS
jgi:tagatose 6-phosphate kinase